MSIGAITKVFATCPEEKSEYLVLIAMADQANDDGRDIWFKWETIAHKARIDERTAQMIVEKLLKKGRLLVETGGAPRGYDLYHIVFPAQPYTRNEFQKNRETRRLEKRATGRTAYGKKRKNEDQEAAPVTPSNTPSEKFSIRELGTESENFSEKAEEFSEKAENFSVGTLVPRPPSAAEMAPETSLTRPLNRSVSNVIEDARGDRLPATPAASVVEQTRAPHTTGPKKTEGQPPPLAAVAVREPVAGGELLSPDGEAAGAAITDAELAHLFGDSEATQEAQEVTVVEDVPRAAPLAALGAPVRRVDDLMPVPELNSRAAALPTEPVYRLVKGMVGGNRAIDDGILETLTPAGAISRQNWLRLTEEELTEVRDVAQLEAKTGGLNFYTVAIRGLDRLIGAPIGQTTTRGAGGGYAPSNIAGLAPARHAEPTDYSADQGKYDVGAHWTCKKDQIPVTIARTEIVKRRNTEGLVYHLSNGQTCNALQLMTGYEFTPAQGGN